MTKICFKYSLHGESKEFNCHGWNIFNDWLPYDGSNPIEMTVIEDNQTKVYTEFEMKRRERHGISYTKIIPIS